MRRLEDQVAATAERGSERGPGHQPPRVFRMRQPRLAEMVADQLRRRIVSGALADGSLLPKQEDLLAEFGVSKPSLREALRILETEGLITVRRGNMGGAVVHVPRPEGAAYMLALAMEIREVRLGDVGNALKHMEPACAALCAERADRHAKVLPALREVQAQMSAALADPIELTRASRRFHELLVLLCGNETMIVVVGALESLWSAHEEAWARSETSHGAFETGTSGKISRDMHAKIIKRIDDGDIDGVTRLVRRHLESSLFYARSVGIEETVNAEALKGW